MTSQRINNAFTAYPREKFLPGDVRLKAHLDLPVPIGYEQTNSQPSTVRRMLTWLDVQTDQTVLDIGYGSGWTTALLSYLVGTNGQVYAVEKVPELVEFGKQNCKQAGVTNAEFFEAGEVFGLPDYAPYDRILVSATARNLPEELVDQLAVGGRMVIPVKNSVYVVTKQRDGSVDITEHHGYAFVPLV